MADLGWFNPDQVEDVSFDTLPEGEYLMQVIASGAKTVKDKPGAGYIELECVILEGPTGVGVKNRKFWFRFNTHNPSTTAQNIGRGHLKACCIAIGIANPRDTLELHNIPFRVKLGVRRGQNGELENVAKAYIPKGAAKPGPTAAQQAAAAANAPAPWAVQPAASPAAPPPATPQAPPPWMTTAPAASNTAGLPL